MATGKLSMPVYLACAHQVSGSHQKSERSYRRVGRMVKGGGLMKQAIFNKSLLQHLACPLSKEPLRYCEKTQELVSDAIGVAYPIIDGIPCLIPVRGRILDSSNDEPNSAK